MSNETQGLGEDIRVRFGIDEELAQRLTTGVSLGGSKDIDFGIQIAAGHGSASKKERTWGVTLHGFGKVLSPANGTWRIVARENGRVFLDKSGVKAGDQIPFSTGTGLTTTFEIEAWWSESASTTLQLRLHAEY